MNDYKLVTEIVGKVIEAGEMAEGPGFTLQDEAGEMIAVSGITEKQAKAIGLLLYRHVSISIFVDSE